MISKEPAAFWWSITSLLSLMREWLHERSKGNGRYRGWWGERWRISFCVSGPHFCRMFFKSWGKCRVLGNFPDNFHIVHASTLSKYLDEEKNWSWPFTFSSLSLLDTYGFKWGEFTNSHYFQIISPLGAGLLSTGSPGLSLCPPEKVPASFCFSLSSISDATSCFLRLLLGNWKAGTRL